MSGRGRALLVVSPHLDDAVLGCGALLAARPGSMVVTALCGVPPDAGKTTGWDRSCGFASAAGAIAARIEEDRAALCRLRAEPVWLPYCDAQYGEAVDPQALGDALLRQIERCNPAQVLMPLGLFHTDHQLVAQACLLARQGDAGARDWIAYEDGLYRRIPGLVQQRLQHLAATAIRLTPDFPECGDRGIKREAALCYASQRRSLLDAGHALDEELLAPERYWRVEPMHARA